MKCAQYLGVRLALFTVAVMLVAVLGGCSGGSPGTTGRFRPSARPTPAGQPTSGASAVTAVKSDWIAFWNGALRISRRLSLLENGAQFASFVRLQEGGPFGGLISQSAATVSSVRVRPAEGEATVTYTILLGGKPLAKNISGTAVYSAGKWLVSTGTFCGLLHLVFSSKTKVPSICEG